jgi:hypothetical protein
VSAAPPPTTVWARLRPTILKSIIGAVVAAAAVAIYGVIVGSFGALELKLLLVIVVFVAFALFALFDAEVVSRRSDRLALAGLIVSVYLLVAGVIVIALAGRMGFESIEERTGEVFLRWIALAVIGRGLMLWLLLLDEGRRAYRMPLLHRVTAATMALAALFALLLSIPTFPWVDEHFPDPYWRSLGVAAILALLGSALIPLLGRFFGRRTPPATPPPGARRLAWPRFEDGTPLPAGPDGTPDFSVLEQPAAPEPPA